MRRVIVESPYASSSARMRRRNTLYARRAMHDCLLRGEAPLASHALYTLPGVLNDHNPIERALGMNAGFAWGRVADVTVVYEDLGISDGMKQGIERAELEGRPVERRSLNGKSK